LSDVPPVNTITEVLLIITGESHRPRCLGLTLHDNTERPETITIGTNELIGTDPTKLPPALARLMAGQWKKGAITPKWDGKAAERIVNELERVV
jgi:UDP-N-acetylglucosamine 2-epimerase